MRTLSDKQILLEMQADPQSGIAHLMEKYTGLLWKIIAGYLQNPEDIKDCINETFSSFYLQFNRYNPDRSSLSVYLSSIARHQAVTRFRHNCGKSEFTRSSGDLDRLPLMEDRGILQSELKTDMEKAMKNLRPDEWKIIRMKYYNGMSVREIADSLHLPYETVKKRHYRSLQKLRRSLLITLLVLALLLLSACTYYILRRCDIIPDIWEILTVEDESFSPTPLVLTGGHRKTDLSSEIPLSPSGQTDTETKDPSVSVAGSPSTAEETSAVSSYLWLEDYGLISDPSVPAYRLEEPVYFETEYLTGTLQAAACADHTLRMTIQFTPKSSTFTDLEQQFSGQITKYDLFPSYTDIYLEKEKLLSLEASPYSASESDTCQIHYYNFTDICLPESETPVVLTLKAADLSVGSAEDLTFTLVPAHGMDVQNHIVWNSSGSYGILALPRLEEDGSLMISISGITEENLPTPSPCIVQDPLLQDGDPNAVRLLDETGKTYTGQRQDPSLPKYSGYYDWNFGCLSPGKYTLNIPFLYLYETLPSDCFLSFNLEDCSFEKEPVLLLGGCIYIKNLELIKTFPGENIPGTDQIACDCPDCRYWKLTLQYTSDSDLVPVRHLLSINLSQKDTSNEDMCMYGCSISSMTPDFSDPAEIEGIKTLLLRIDPRMYDLTSPVIVEDPYSPFDDILYRLDLNMNIPITVPTP